MTDVQARPGPVIAERPAIGPVVDTNELWFRRFLYLDGLMAAAFLVAFIDTHRRRIFPPPFIQEDKIVENLTLAFYVLAMLIALAGMFRSSGVRRWVNGLVVFLSALFALDEISFGERLLGFNPPVVLDVRIDAAHDFFHLLLRFLKLEVQARPIVTLAWVGALGIVGLAGTWILRRRLVTWLIASWRDSAGRYVLISVAMGLISLVTDMISDPWEFVRLIEETAEATTGLAMIFAALSFHRRL